VRRNVLPKDALFAFSSAGEKQDLRYPVSSSGGIDLLHYRSYRKSKGRVITITFSGDPTDPPFPLTHAYIARDGPAALLHAAVESVRRPEKFRQRRTIPLIQDAPSGRMSYLSLLQVVISLGISILVVILTAALLITKCGWRDKTGSASRAALRQSEIALLSDELHCERPGPP
jgi:hypothetical protein